MYLYTVSTITIPGPGLLIESFMLVALQNKMHIVIGRISSHFKIVFLISCLNIWYIMDCFLQSAHVTCWAQMQKQVHVIARQGSAFVDQMWLAWTVTSVEITTGKLQVEWVVRPAIVILLGLMLSSAIKWVNKTETEVTY
jgi:hypothetical protein